jgi:hypothetical protein
MTTALVEYDGLKARLRDAAAEDPIDSLMVTVLGGALLFYYAEKGHNPKVETYFDALVYVSTCVSVGYADIFPKTKAGKTIATALMTFGPAIAAAALEPPADGAPPLAGARSTPGTKQPEPIDPKLLEVQRVLCDKLDAILMELRAGKAA